MLRTRHLQSMARILLQLSEQRSASLAQRCRGLRDCSAREPESPLHRGYHGSTGLFAEAALAQESEAQAATVIFPRERDGVSYALNWALAGVGVAPQGQAYRNLKEAKLKSEHKAKAPGSTSGTAIRARGANSAGATPLDKKAFNKLFKEVTGHLSTASTLFVHDGAVGSAPATSAKVRTVSDSPNSALAFQKLMNTTSLRDLSADAFPLTVYASSSGDPSIAVDYERGAVLVQGKAVGDQKAITMALAALAGPQIASAGSVPLAAGRCLVKENSTLLVLAPESLVQSSPALAAGSVSDAPGVAWSEAGLARYFGGAKDAPNLLAPPAALVVVTSDSTGAVPSISKISAPQAAYFFLAGYNGKEFVPGLVEGPSAVDPVAVAQQLSALVQSSGVATYLVNASGVSDSEVDKLLSSAAAQKALKSKKPNEEAVAALKEKFTAYMSSKYPELPEGISM